MKKSGVLGFLSPLDNFFVRWCAFGAKKKRKGADLAIGALVGYPLGLGLRIVVIRLECQAFKGFVGANADVVGTGAWVGDAD